MHRIEAKVNQFYAEIAEMKELLRGQAEARVSEGAATYAETLEREQAALSLCRPHDFHNSNTELVDPGGDIGDIISALQNDISSEEVDSNFDFISALVLWRGTSTALIPVARSASPKPQKAPSPSGYGATVRSGRPSVSDYDHANINSPSAIDTGLDPDPANDKQPLKKRAIVTSIIVAYTTWGSTRRSNTPTVAGIAGRRQPLSNQTTAMARPAPQGASTRVRSMGIDQRLR